MSDTLDYVDESKRTVEVVRVTYSLSYKRGRTTQAQAIESVKRTLERLSFANEHICPVSARLTSDMKRWLIDVDFVPLAGTRSPE